MTRYGMVIDLNRCIGCRACSVGCTLAHGLPAGDRWAHVKESVAGTFPNLEITDLPTLCMHCAKPLCVAACSTGASYIDENGVVLVDKNACDGCGACVEACPYGARSILTEIKSNHGDQGPTPYEEAHFAAMKTSTAEKCTFCAERREQGEDPLCVKTCVASARLFGDLDDPESDVAKAAVNGKVLLKSEGTEPSVFYLYDGTNNLDEVFTS